MHKIALAALLLSATAVLAPSRAQSGAQSGALPGRLTPAPVPDRDLNGVDPANRAGRPDGSERAAPFSGLPNTLGAGTGQETPATDGAPQTRTSPSPDLSR